MIGPEIRTLRKTYRKYLGNVVLETNRVTLCMTKRRNANGIGHILRRNCLLKHFVEQKVEGKIEVTERQGITRKQLLDDIKVKRGFCKLKGKEIARTLLRTRIGRDCGSVVRRTIE